MSILPTTNNCVVVTSNKELNEAKMIDVCGHIIREVRDKIIIYDRVLTKWVKKTYTISGELTENDDERSGFSAYQSFYSYCGKDEIDKMKKILSPISFWDSCEQMHYANIEFVGKKIYKNIYQFDANSSFTYGVLRLPDGFQKLKEYMLILYDKKKSATTKIVRQKYKNLQNYLIGYFARIKDFIRVRSDIIMYSNENITSKICKITEAGGTVYLSNTDSIVTDEIGAEVMSNFTSDKVGSFKLEGSFSKLFYNSSNSYQLDNKVTFSGVKYFARKHTDFFEDKSAVQSGSLVKPYNFAITDDKEYKKICSVKKGMIIVRVFNNIGELIESHIYKLEDKGE